MSRFKATDLLDRTFEVGIILKGLDGVLEVAGGVLPPRREPSHDQPAD
jgi:uncharacterized membrane protein